ncbi:MAG: hypothetical protein K6E33_08570 [Lachnospiraceae bacterium]|nr:hypothetical protein [Lachnospiraceae bacterium]
MRHLIRADMVRILKKISFYVLIVLYFVLLIVTKNGDNAEEQLNLMEGRIILGSRLIIIPIFLAVYGDEFRTGSMQTVIGRGLSRGKVVIAKLMDCGFLMLPVLLLAFVIALIKNENAQVAVTVNQNLNMFLTVFQCFLWAMGYFACGALLLFAMWSVAAGMIALITSALFLNGILELAQSQLHFPFFDLSYEGLINKAFAAFQDGSFGWQIIPALAVYFCGSVYLSIRLFDRKELEL